MDAANQLPKPINGSLIGTSQSADDSDTGSSLLRIPDVLGDLEVSDGVAAGILA